MMSHRQWHLTLEPGDTLFTIDVPLSFDRQRSYTDFSQEVLA